MQSNCLHLIPTMAQENYGSYKCVSKEKDYTKTVKNYQLQEQRIQITDGRSNTPDRINDASAVVPQIWLIVGLAVALMGILR